MIDVEHQLHLVAAAHLGIVCRPGCTVGASLSPERTEPVTYARAVAGGFMPCPRCRPRLAVHEKDVPGGAVTVRALSAIRDGVVDDVGIAGLARLVGLSERQLHRHVTVAADRSPQQLALSRRAQTFRLLVHHSTLTAHEAGTAAGFASTRQLASVVRDHTGMTPAALRRHPDRTGLRRAVADTPLAWRLRLGHNAPYDLGASLLLLSAHAVGSLERYDPAHSTLRRHMRTASGWASVAVRLGRSPGHADLRLRLSHLSGLDDALAQLQRWLDLGQEPEHVSTALTDVASLLMLPDLARSVRRRPGLRVPGTVDPLETAVVALLLDALPLEHAGVVLTRLGTGFGHAMPDGLHLPPTAEALEQLGPRAIALRLRLHEHVRPAVATHVALAVHQLACLVRRGGSADHALLRAPATVLSPGARAYLLMRLGRTPTVPLPGSRIARATGLRSPAALAAATGSGPWRSYAWAHVWADELVALRHRAVLHAVQDARGPLPTRARRVDALRQTAEPA